MKKSHTCEEGGVQLRISFWHLLMNFENPEKLEFKKKKKKKKKIGEYKQNRLWHMKNKDMRQSHTSSQHSEAIDV